MFSQEQGVPELKGSKGSTAQIVQERCRVFHSEFPNPSFPEGSVHCQEKNQEENKATHLPKEAVQHVVLDDLKEFADEEQWSDAEIQELWDHVEDKKEMSMYAKPVKHLDISSLKCRQAN
ncbi:unnamed protein product [Durusdinium trenchii]|uniref:Uncharacterized protein n=1 Tax=Durusdinium trenchii TaxID=1381693 RepID=A0ABP0SKH8_9DINO